MACSFKDRGCGSSCNAEESKPFLVFQGRESSKETWHYFITGDTRSFIITFHDLGEYNAHNLINQRKDEVGTVNANVVSTIVLSC
jgi:hypothetical protein